MSDALKVGDVAPEFELMDQEKRKIKLSDFKGKKKVALLFYPMDFSPVCTGEFCEFGPAQNTIDPKHDTVIFGINCDHPFSHAEFKAKHKLPYDLLSDVTRKISKAYGMFAGEEPYNCSKRGTVVIGLDGKISFFQEVTMGAPRTLDSIVKAVAS